MDMSRFILARSDQLNADDLLGGSRIITITGVRGTDAADQPVSVSYEGDAGKPYKPCKSMRRVMVHCWGKDAANYTGRSMELYCDPDVQFGGMKVGGIRISKMSHIDGKKSMALTATRGKKGLFTVHPLTDVPARQQEPIIVPKDVVDRLQEAASRGMKALEAAWRERTIAEYRPQLEPRLPSLKEAAREADAAADFGPEPEPAQQDNGGGYDGV